MLTKNSKICGFLFQLMITLVRHGQSESNACKKFGGWLDVPLTNLGIEQAHQTGKMLKKNNIQFDICCTSFLQRAKITRKIILDEINQPNIPVFETWRLNEVHSGAFSGNYIDDLDLHFTPGLMSKWASIYDFRPPFFEEGGIHDPKLDPMYKDVEGHDQLPLGESFDDACKRLQVFWDSTIIPNLSQGKSILIVSHGNLVRIMMKMIENLSPEECMKRMVIPNCTAVIYPYARDHFGERKIIGSPEALSKYELIYQQNTVHMNL